MSTLPSLNQDNTPGSVFTVIADGAYEGSATAVMMSQNQDMFNTTEKILSFSNNGDGNGQATFTLTVADKDSVFNGNSTDNDTVQITVNKTADNAVIYAAADMTVLTYVVPAVPEAPAGATSLSVANGTLFSTITFGSAVGSAANEAITSVNLVRSDGTPAGASAAANQSGGITFTNIALSTDGSTDFAATDNAGEYTLKVTGLTDFTYYEAAVQTVSLIGNSPMSATVQLAPSNNMHAPTMSAETLNAAATPAVTGSSEAPTFNGSLAQLTCNWSDPDAGSLVKSTGTNSHAILQISTDNFLTITNAITLTNAQCTAAVTGGVTIKQNVGTGTYKSRIISDSTTSPLNQTGLNSAALQVFVQTAASMTSPLVAAVTMSSGEQTFAATYTDATVAGTQVLTMTDDGAALGVGAAVVDGANKTSTSDAVSYANLDGAAIVATLTVQDANSPAISYTYTSTTYTTAQFKTAAAPTNLSCETLDSTGAVTVVGAAPTFNATDAQVTVKWEDANAAQFISSATSSDNSKATMKFYKAGMYVAKDITLTNAQCTAATSGLVTFTQQVTGSGSNASVEYKARIVSSQLNQPSGFLADGSDSAAQAVLIQTAATLTSPLVAAVTMSTGVQTFAATYGVATVAGTQTLTFADAGANLGPTTDVTASGTISSNSVSYADCADGSIVATLTVYDANSPAISYTYNTGTAFTTEQFKAPAAPTATFDINAIGNDNTFKTTLTAINANNGFGDATNMTWQVSTSAAASGLLSDCSGVYNPIANGQQEDIVGPTGANAFVVNSSYYLLVTKTNTYANAGGNYPTSTGVPATIDTAAAYIGAVKYKGNPVVNSIQYTVGFPTAVVTVSLNQTTLAATNALTLFTMSNLGTATGNIVHTDITTVNNPAVAPDILIETDMIATFQVNIGHNATINTFGIAAVDCDDGHTAIHTHNLPAHVDYNSATA